jgi:hypothetical protein
MSERREMKRSGLSKGDRALELYEKGLDHTVIAERLGLQLSNVRKMIENAKSRRDRNDPKERDMRP